jgi:hypothetical protein
VRFWIVLATLVLIALGFTLVISAVNLNIQEIGSMSIVTGLLAAMLLLTLPERQS